MGFGQSAVSAVSQAVCVDGLGDGGLATGSQRVRAFPFIGVLLLPHACLDLLLGLGQQEDVASLALGVAGAPGAVGALPAVCLPKIHPARSQPYAVGLEVRRSRAFEAAA